MRNSAKGGRLNRALLDRLLCPACGAGEWTVRATDCEEIPYTDETREEIRTGEVICACGREYPVREYVLSFSSLFPPDLKREAAFWDRFYLWHLEQGATGFHDLRHGLAPFMGEGVREEFPYAHRIDRYDVHYQIAEHPMLRAGRTLLDVGVGLGWTSLHFARSGYQVTAFDPGLGPQQAAKAYAIKEGLYIEYLCAAIGHVNFREAAFDNVVAFHSLHHVPDLAAGLQDVQRWLRPGGALAVDEHVASSQLAHAIQVQVDLWARANVFPHYRDISDADLAGRPPEPHSALEDAGVDQVVPLLRSMFDIQLEKQRHIFLDHYPLLYYLWKNKEESAFVHALEISNQFQEMVRLADPDGGDYITLIAANRAPGTTTEASSTYGEGITSHLSNNGTGPTTRASRIAEIENAFAEQTAWALSLETALKQRNRELEQMRAHLRRIEEGRVMRLLRRIRR